MSKNDFMKKVKEALDLTSIKVADEVVEKLTNLIVELTKSGEEITLGSLGKFSVVEREARTCRHPKTGEQIEVPAKKSLKFKVSGTLKKALNS